MTSIALPLPFLLELNAREQGFLDAVVMAHQAEAARGSDLSTQVFVAAMVGSGSPINAAAAAMLSAGGQHGPVGPARFIYDHAKRDQIKALIAGQMGPGMRRIPGFGHSTFKDQVDPVWKPVEELIEGEFVNVSFRIKVLTAWVNENRPNKPMLFPNGTMFTAAMCSELKVPRGLELVIPLLARLPVWCGLQH